MEIDSSETADFPITLENLGNGPTIVQIDPIDIPGGNWNVNIASGVTLGSTMGDGNLGDSEETVHLIIKPPSTNGYESKRQDFRIKFTPYYLGNPSLKGTPEIMTFTLQVENDNFAESQNGFGVTIGIIVVIIILIIAAIIFLVLYKNRKFK
jgi:hypothetical protein